MLLLQGAVAFWHMHIAVSQGLLDEYGENFIVGCDAKYTRGRIDILHSFSSIRVASAARGRFTAFHIDGEFPVEGFLRITISFGFLVHQRQLVCAFSVVGQLQDDAWPRVCAFLWCMQIP